MQENGNFGAEQKKKTKPKEETKNKSKIIYLAVFPPSPSVKRLDTSKFLLLISLNSF